LIAFMTHVAPRPLHCASIPTPLAPLLSVVFFFNDPATPDISTLSLHDALPISAQPSAAAARSSSDPRAPARRRPPRPPSRRRARSEEHTSELQSLTNLVCRLLLEKKKKRTHTPSHPSTAARH